MATKSLLDPITRKLLSEAVASELYASNLYKHLANQLQRLGYFGASAYFAKESMEELAHYQRLADYFNDRGDCAWIPSVPAMDEKVESLRDAIEVAYETESQLGRQYEKAYVDTPGVTTKQFLLWYLEEQRVSIGKYADLLARLDRVGDDECGILLVDQEMKP